jgi:hypothetical protein
MGCGADSLTAPVATTVAVADSTPTLISVTSWVNNWNSYLGDEYRIDINTTIVGRSNATFADSTIAHSDDPTISTIGQRALWEIADSGIDPLSRKGFVKIHEVYMVKSRAYGTTNLKFTSVRDRNAYWVLRWSVVQ